MGYEECCCAFSGSSHTAVGEGVGSAGAGTLEKKFLLKWVGEVDCVQVGLRARAHFAKKMNHRNLQNHLLELEKDFILGRASYDDSNEFDPEDQLIRIRFEFFDNATWSKQSSNILILPSDASIVDTLDSVNCAITLVVHHLRVMKGDNE